MSVGLSEVVGGVGTVSFVDNVSVGLSEVVGGLGTVSFVDNVSVGLSEVVGGLGTEKLQSLMPDIMHTATRADVSPHVRDGYIMMFIYLPVVFTDDFLPYVGPIIPSILKVRSLLVLVLSVQSYPLYSRYIVA